MLSGKVRGMAVINLQSPFSFREKIQYKSGNELL
jgi:hypothetical protein